MTRSGVTIKAPNGKEYFQPTGLFINNEWFDSSDGGMLGSINPAYVKYSLPTSIESQTEGVASSFNNVMSTNSPSTEPKKYMFRLRRD